MPKGLIPGLVGNNLPIMIHSKPRGSINFNYYLGILKMLFRYPSCEKHLLDDFKRVEICHNSAIRLLFERGRFQVANKKKLRSR